MKFHHLALVFVLISGGAQVQGESIALVDQGKSEFAIVLSESASPSEKHAAREFAHFIHRISGADLRITERPSERMVLIGEGEILRSLDADIDFDDLGDEGFAVRTVGPHLVIAGGRLRGTMYGVYAFLEEVLGCRWYSSKVSRIPKMPTISLQPLDIHQKPDFEYREPFYADAFDADWAARNRVNSNNARLDESRGGKIEYYHFVHTFGLLVPADKYFEDHPEYFSLVDGRRISQQTQLCMSNPEVVRIATETVLSWIEERPGAKIYSVSHNDWYNNCQCENCTAVDKEEGSPAGLLLRFVNAIAEEVEKKHPDKLIDTLAYQWTEQPPKITKPRHNVRIRLCPIFACQFHPYEQCPQNAGFVSNLRGWNEVTDNLYAWHYNTNFGHYVMPWPDLEQLVPSIRLYKRTGVKGVFAQGNYSAGGGGFMDELKAFLIAKLLWNTQADEKAIIADFLSGYFGKAGKPIGEFLDLLHEKVRNEDLHGNIYVDIWADYLSSDILSAGERLFDQAEELAESPEISERVKHSRLGIRYVKVMRETFRAAADGSPEEKSAALKQFEDFVNDCKARGITELNEWIPIDRRFEELSQPLR